MKCRTIIDGNVVWFGSQGIDDNTGRAIRADNYSEGQQAVSSSLTQRLSVLKRELWYKIDFGLPLFDKIKSKAIIDSNVIATITSNEDVVRIESFESSLVDKVYSCSAKIMTKYGLIDLNYN